MCKIGVGKLLYGTGSSDQCFVKTYMGGMGSGREAQNGWDTGMLIADACCCISETNTAL